MDRNNRKVPAYVTATLKILVILDGVNLRKSYPQWKFMRGYLGGSPWLCRQVTHHTSTSLGKRSG